MKKIIITLAVISIVVLCYWVYTKKSYKSAYIITGNLYESYKGTKELQSKVITQQNRYKLVLDSLRIEINLNMSDIANKQKNARTDELKKQYNALATDFKKYNEEYVQSEQAKVWSQLNEYIQTYGKENNYDYIYGADGSGNIMYADSSFNITKEIVEFANSKYDGK